MANERDLEVAHDLNGTLRTGKPFRSDLVTHYMAFVREEQKKTGVEVSQAPALLHSRLAAIIAHMSHLLIQRTLRLPNECGPLLDFQWGKTYETAPIPL